MCPYGRNDKLELGGKLMLSVAITKLNEIEDLDETILLRELNSQKEIEYFFVDSGRYKNPATFDSFNEYFQLLDEIAKEHKIEKVIGITSNYLPSNYFSESDYRSTSIIGTYDWNENFAPPSVTVYLIFQIVAHTINILVKEDIYHKETRACIFDWKMNKMDIYLSLRSGLICPECRQKLKNKISERVIIAMERILEHNRVTTTQLDQLGKILSPRTSDLFKKEFKEIEGSYFMKQLWEKIESLEKYMKTSRNSRIPSGNPIIIFRGGNYAPIVQGDNAQIAVDSFNDVKQIIMNNEMDEKKRVDLIKKVNELERVISQKNISKTKVSRITSYLKENAPWLIPYITAVIQRTLSL